MALASGLWPGAYKIVPGKVIRGLGVSDLDETRIAMLFGKMPGEADKIAGKTKV